MELHHNFMFFIEVLGTVAFAMSGAFAAMQRRFDPFGVVIIAFVTAIGGGTVRDWLIGVPVAWMRDLTICMVVLVTALGTMIFHSKAQNFKITLFIFDSLGLGLFTVVGIQKGLQADLSMMICIVLGTITGCFGGVIRDTLLNRIPLIFRKEIYATACIFGGLVYMLLLEYTPLSFAWVQILTILLIVVIRTLAVKYHLKIPKFYTHR